MTLKFLAKSTIMAFVVGLMTWLNDYLLAAFVLFSTSLVVAARSPVLLGKSLLVATPLSVGLSWFNGLMAMYRGGDPIATGLLVAARVYALASISSYFVLTTDPYELAHDLSKFVRPSVAYAFYTAYMLALRSMEYSRELLAVYKSRRLIGSSIGVLRVIVPLMVSLINNALRTSEYLGMSMESRWLNDGRVFWRNPRLTVREVAELILIAAIPVFYVTLWRGVA